MRLKEDSSSWNASNVLRKMKEIPEYPSRPKRKKDTKKWCKGKVGVKHNYNLIKETKFHIYVWKQYKCVNCGKKEYK